MLVYIAAYFLHLAPHAVLALTAYGRPTLLRARRAVGWKTKIRQ